MSLGNPLGIGYGGINQAYQNQLSQYYNSLQNQSLPQGSLAGLAMQNQNTYLDEKKLIELMNECMFKIPNKLVLDPNSTNRKMPKITSNTYVGVSATTGAVVSVDKDLTVVKREAAQVAHKEEGAVIVFKPVFQVEPKRDVVETEITLT